MYRIFYIIILISFSSNILFSQSPEMEWMKSYENTASAYYDNTGHSVQQTYDGGFIIAGDLWPASGTNFY